MATSRRRFHLQSKFTIASLALAVILCAVLAATSYLNFKNNIVARYEAQITGIVNTLGLAESAAWS